MTDHDQGASCGEESSADSAKPQGSQVASHAEARPLAPTPIEKKAALLDWIEQSARENKDHAVIVRFVREGEWSYLYGDPTEDLERALSAKEDEAEYWKASADQWSRANMILRAEVAALKHDIERHVQIASKEAAARIEAEDNLRSKCVCEFTGSGNERKINKTCEFHARQVAALKREMDMFKARAEEWETLESRWPGGLEEVESSIKQFKARAEKAERELDEAVRREREACCSDIRRLVGCYSEADVALDVALDAITARARGEGG